MTHTVADASTALGMTREGEASDFRPQASGAYGLRSTAYGLVFPMYMAQVGIHLANRLSGGGFFFTGRAEIDSMTRQVVWGVLRQKNSRNVGAANW